MGRAAFPSPPLELPCAYISRAEISILRVIESPLFSPFFFPLKIREQKTIALLTIADRFIVVGRVHFPDNFVIQR